MEKDYKILLVSDTHHFSTRDVYQGYKEAFEKMKINFDVADTTELARYLSPEMTWGLVLAKMLTRENNFTHILFVSGMMVPDWLWASKYEKNIGVIACDDPHASKILMNNKKYMDYYFTNEKKMANEKENIYYLPMATSSHLPTLSKEEVPDAFKCDVSFVGTFYDDRIKPLEEVCNYCVSRGLKVKFAGPLCRTPQDSILRKYTLDGILSNAEAKLLYRGSKLVINVDRNIHWNPMEKEDNSWLIDVGKPYSTNPRAYEIAGCRAPQLYISPRGEARDIFGDSCFYCDYNNIEEALNKIFNKTEDEILDMTNRAFNTVVQKHTYLNRAKKLLDIISLVDMTNKLANNVLLMNGKK